MSRFTGRRQALLLIAAACAGSLSSAWAQHLRRLPRLGYLLQSPLTEPPSRERRAFLDGLQELGYEPGRTIEIVYRSAEAEPEFMDDMARELLKEPLDVIVVSGANAAMAAKRATRSIPIVMLALGDPVGTGAVKSLARPGGNVTGVSFISSDLAAKRVQLAREIVPQARRLAILWDRRNANARHEATAATAAAARLRLEPESLALASDAELARTLEALSRRRPDVLYAAFEGGLIAGNRTAIAEFGIRHRVPVVSGWSFMAEAGALISYAPDIPRMFRRGAYYVHRILQGTAPADLPVEQPTKVELVVNMRTARALGITIPQSVLLRADRVIS